MNHLNHYPVYLLQHHAGNVFADANKFAFLSPFAGGKECVIPVKMSVLPDEELEKV